MAIFRFVPLTAMLVAFAAAAAEYQPYPEAKITTEQWQEYHSVVEAELGASKQEIAEAKLVTYHDESGATIFAFTLPDHPAHPAWITRKVVQNGDAISIEQVGYFAGEEEPFAALFDDYLSLTDEIQAEIEAQQVPQE